MSQEFTITIEKGVAIPDGQTRGGIHAKHKEKLTSMRIGDSFFLENITKDEIANLIRYAKRLGVHLLARDTDEDEDYLAPGVRAWRVEQEDLPGRKPNKPTVSKSMFDDDDTPDTAPRTKEDLRQSIIAQFDSGLISNIERDKKLSDNDLPPPDLKHWHNKKEHLVMKTDGSVAKLKGFVEIGAERYGALLACGEAFDVRTEAKADKAPQSETYAEDTYWYHAESDSVWVLDAGEPIPADIGAHNQIDKELFDAVMYAQNTPANTCLWTNESRSILFGVDNDEIEVQEYLILKSYDIVTQHEAGRILIKHYDNPTYWRSPETGSILQKPPGYMNGYHFTPGWEECEGYEYDAECIRHAPDYDTYWRRANGTCTIVPPEKYEKACSTAGAVQIGERAYQSWLLKQAADDEL